MGRRHDEIGTDRFAEGGDERVLEARADGPRGNDGPEADANRGERERRASWRRQEIANGEPRGGSHRSPDTGKSDHYAERRKRRSGGERDRKSTRLNSSHLGISYAVFCLKKKNERSNDYYEGCTNSVMGDSFNLLWAEHGQLLTR